MEGGQLPVNQDDDNDDDDDNIDDNGNGVDDNNDDDVDVWEKPASSSDMCLRQQISQTPRVPLPASHTCLWSQT